MADDIGGLSWEQFRALPLDRRSSHLASFQRLGGIVDTSNIPPGTLFEIDGGLHTKIPEQSPGLTGEHIRGRHRGVRSRSSGEFDLDVATVGVGLALGTSQVIGVGQAIAEAVGKSLGSSIVEGVGSSIATATGVSLGGSSAEGFGSSIAEATGESLGSSSAAGVGQSVAEAAGQSDGTSMVAGVSDTEGIGFGVSIGASSVLGIGESIAEGTGQAAGTSTATCFSVAGVGDMAIEDPEPHTEFQVY